MELIIEPLEVTKNEKQVEIVILVTSKESLEKNKLYEVALKQCNNAMIVEKIEDLYLNYVKRFKRVGLMIDYLASKDLVDKIIKLLKDIETENYMYQYER